MKHPIFFLAILLTISCKDNSKTVPINKTTEKQVAQSEKSHPGKKILESECYICHAPRASEESMIAPPMFAIKKFYLDSNTTKEAFTKALINWVNDPEAESKMPAARQKFGVMPYIPYSDEVIAQIAEYLYDYEIEKPSWFDAHFKEQHGQGSGQTTAMDDVVSGNIKKGYADIGMEYAKAAKTALGKNLLKAIQKEGTAGAVEFCHIEALSLTDSVSVMNNAIIKRVSDRPRNTANTANTEELGYIEYFKKLTAAGKEPKPIVKTENGEVDIYYPITTNTMCLQCHGKPNEQIQPETLGALKRLYPSDAAIGYKANEVRGIWAINFEENTIE